MFPKEFEIEISIPENDTSADGRWRSNRREKPEQIQFQKAHPRSQSHRRLARVRGATTQKRNYAEAYDLARRIFSKRGTQRTLDEAKSKDKEDSAIPLGSVAVVWTT
eukprot:gb/GECG01008736.1/.p1 GENE.gb/GECG01008736.1/~~gb/GECG01008736.1/.p1  ORF type:complete len:107 (+),score=13.83 gb/GECG01008736.1/:1-321(+)